MNLPAQSKGVNRTVRSRRASRPGVRPALARFGFGVGPTCSCISHGDSTLWECCKIGTDECRACVGETTDECCKNIGKPSPVPIPSLGLFFV